MPPTEPTHIHTQRHRTPQASHCLQTPQEPLWTLLHGHTAHTHHHICSSPVYLGMNKGPQCQNDKLWLLIVNDGLTQHNNSQKHHSMPSHTPPMLYTPSIGVLLCTPLWHLQIHPNVPTHTPHTSMLLCVCTYRHTAGTHTPGLPHTPSTPAVTHWNPRSHGLPPTPFLYEERSRLSLRRAEGAENLSLWLSQNVGLLSTYGSVHRQGAV